MTYEGLVKMLEGDFANMCAKELPLASRWGDGWTRQVCADREGGPPSERSEFNLISQTNIHHIQTETMIKSE